MGSNPAGGINLKNKFTYILKMKNSIFISIITIAVLWSLVTMLYLLFIRYNYLMLVFLYELVAVVPVVIILRKEFSKKEI